VIGAASTMDYQQIVLLYGVLLVSLVVHEASHALFALWGGDRTAYVGGQVSLNPIPHIQREPFGTVILPLLVLFMSKGTMILGYAHIPVDPVWAERYPKRAALMSAAGPIANFALCAVAFVGLKALCWTGLADAWPAGSGLLGPFVTPVDITNDYVYAAARIGSAFLTLNLLLGIFNLFPWPPLDGAGVLGGLSRPLGTFYAFARTQPILMLIGIVAVWRLIPYAFEPVAVRVLNWL